MNTKLNKLFENYNVLKDIDNKNKNIIQNNVQFREIAADQLISSVNVSCSGIIFVIEGIINIRRINEEGDETNLYNIGKGEICHEALSCIMNYKMLNIYAKAVVNSTIAVISKSVFNEYLLKDSEFMQYAYKDIFNKFNYLIEKKEDRNNASLRSRLIRYILKDNNSIIYTTHKQIADEIDCSREAVSRKLKDLEKEKYIKLSRGKITIINMGLLIKNADK